MGSVAAIYAERLLSLQRIAALADRPISRLQDWGTLAGILAAAAIAAALAGAALHWTHWSSLATLLAGATVLAATYPVALNVTGQWRQLEEFIASLRAARA